MRHVQTAILENVTSRPVRVAKTAGVGRPANGSRIASAGPLAGNGEGIASWLVTSLLSALFLQPACSSSYFGAGPSPVEDGQAWLKQARAGWQRIENRALPRAWDLRVFERRDGDGDGVRPGKKITFGSVRLIENGRWQLFVEGKASEENALENPARLATLALVCNDDYAFHIERTSPGRPWQIVAVASKKELEDAPPDDPRYRWYRRYFSAVRQQILLASVSEDGILLSELMEWEGARIKSAGKDGAFVHVTVQFPNASHVFPRSGVERRFQKERLDLWLDPKHDWRIVKSIKKGPSGRTRVRKLTYDDAGYVQTESWQRSGGPREETHVVNVRVECDHDKKVFRLPAFGIPEPDELRPRGSRWPWYVAAGMAGIDLIVMGVKLRRS